MMACSAHTLRSSFEPSHLLFVLYLTYTSVAGLEKVHIKPSRKPCQAIYIYAPALCASVPVACELCAA